MTLPVLYERTGAARVNWGRWVSRCPTPGCTNAWLVDLSVILWACRECWAITQPTWPADPIAVEWLLSQRPDETTRNWEGESLTELLAENIAHGLVPAVLAELGDGADVLTVHDGRPVSGALASAIEQYRELTGSPGTAGATELPGGN